MHASFHFRIRRNAFSRNILHLKGKLAPTIFCPSTNAFPTIALHYEGKVVDASFSFSTSKNALPTTTLHHE